VTATGVPSLHGSVRYVDRVHVRVTGIVIENDCILLLNQDTDTSRSWSLPGGKVEARRTGGTVGDVAVGLDSQPIRGVEFVKLADLRSLGFSERFADLAASGFPGAGSYMGPKSSIGL
jgi:hypothetical protein